MRLERISQAWPLFYFGSAILGLLMCAAGLISSRYTLFTYGLFFILPLVLLIGNVIFVVTIAAALNLGLLVWNLVNRQRSGRG